jgi:HemY protein
LFRARTNPGKSIGPAIPAVIPLVRAPDDPGVDEEPVSDEFTEQTGPVQAQPSGWRGFLSRWGN